MMIVMMILVLVMIVGVILEQGLQEDNQEIQNLRTRAHCQEQ
jgi:hypothetical protein